MAAIHFSTWETLNRAVRDNYLTVKDAKGKEQVWRLESLAPGGLIRQGLKVKTDLKIGETYTFNIVPAWKDPADAKMGWITSLVVNGKEFVVVEL